MNNGLYYYKLISPYTEDVTKNCKLTINEIDHNFLTLKDNDIVDAKFVRDDKTLVLIKNNNEKIVVNLDDIVYDLDIKKECGESGTTLTFSYDGKDGKKTVTLENILTVDNLKDAIGSEILTKVITDGTLTGNGTVDSPLGIKGTEKTGMFAPVKGIIDVTNGCKLPTSAKLGTRFITKEYINDYGYLYNGDGLEKIASKLAADCRGWRIPTKADWDALLNAIEPCEYRNHNSAKCHVELGRFAGKFLKSECGWVGQKECECTITKPLTGCSYNEQIDDYIDTNSGCGCMGGNSGDTSGATINGWYDVNCGDVPFEKCESPSGIDKFGMSILPAGSAILDGYGRPQPSAFKEDAFFWTTTHVYGDEEQDLYVKDFDWNKCGVIQAAECPDSYYSVRLVKDYDGSNYFGGEYIDGVLYDTILFPQSGQIWLATNFASKEGFIEYECGGQTPELLEVNNGEVLEKRKELFINEWNGCYWEKKLLHEGDTVVVENTCFDDSNGGYKEISWVDSEGVTHTIEVEIPSSSQRNNEYRVYTSDSNCDKELVNTDDLVVERVLNIVVPFVDEERVERMKGDAALSGEIETRYEQLITGLLELWRELIEEVNERKRADIDLYDKIISDASLIVSGETEQRISADTELWSALNEEVSARTTADEALSGAIETEREERISGDEALSGAIETEREERVSGDEALSGAIETEREERINDNAEIEGKLIDASEEYTLKVSEGLVLESKDKNPDNFIKVKFDGNFGEI